LEERQNEKSEMKRGSDDVINKCDEDWERRNMQRSERKHGNGEKRRGHRNKLNGTEKNEIKRWGAFEFAGKLRNWRERAVENHSKPKSTENEQNNKRRENSREFERIRENSREFERIRELRKTTMKWMGCEQVKKISRHRAREDGGQTQAGWTTTAKIQADRGKVERIRMTLIADYTS
jgi:hypothetical protein